MIRDGAGAAVLLVASAASAGAEPWMCAFSVICTAGLECVPREATARIIAADHEGQLFLEYQGDALLAEQLGSDLAYSARSPDGTALLSIGRDGTAWLTTHFAAASTLFGSCQRVGS